MRAVSYEAIAQTATIVASQLNSTDLTPQFALVEDPSARTAARCAGHRHSREL